MTKIVKFSASRIHESLAEGLRAIADYRNEEDLDPAEREAFLRECEVAVISGGTKVGDDYLSLMPSLRMIGDFGVGYDGVDVEKLNARGIKASHTPGVLNDDVADLGFLLLGAVARRIAEGHVFATAGLWDTQGFPLATSLCGMKVGIAGMGRIGRELAARCAAFKMEISYFCRHERPDLPYRFFASLEEMAAHCDALVMVVPATPETRGCVNAQVLRALGREGILVNIARGAVVDTEALIAALESRSILGAGLDVFDHEPHIDPRLRGLPNVVLAPHVGSATERTRRGMGMMVLENIKAYLAGKPLLNPIPGTQA
ncbi:MAG: 2-hydroxyacid dehydrogenase [Succinivibrionaceae bacterium]|nr:2-hydroxyacid dehydrogenase [Succinivibrionaceae bacterium]